MNNFSMITMATLGNCTLILLLTPTASASFALHAPELHALPVPTHAKLDTPVKLSNWSNKHCEPGQCTSNTGTGNWQMTEGLVALYGSGTNRKLIIKTSCSVSGDGRS
ncbi:hypothetical protein KC19_1G068400 [Ceratodon purpureus]|uniref:Uncharacterized protein n=1 Tax=Ceratodon purpureus TaxID=3225 RepID=A0A8T0J5F5_CERPU|nr:hypothetical protein KC19_1G068400 [Ceratodon purpureus]